MTMPRSRFRRALRLRLALVLSLSSVVVARAHAEQAAPPAAPAATWGASAVNVTRFESWSFFEPQPGGGDPDYTFLGNRLRIEARGRWRRVAVTLAAQHVGLVGLPTGASGPGALGTGALYTKIHGTPPAEADFRQFFRVTPPVVHQMIKTLHAHGFIEREPGKARSIRLCLTRAQLPDLE